MNINNRKLIIGAAILKSIYHKLRQRIIEALIQYEPMTADEMATKIKTYPSVSFHHLNILIDSGIVLTERNAELTYYSLNFSRFKLIQNVIQGLIKDMPYDR